MKNLGLYCFAAGAVTFIFGIGSAWIYAQGAAPTDTKPNFTGLWAPPPAVARAAPSSPEDVSKAAPQEVSRFQGGNAPKRLTRRERGLQEVPLADWGKEAFLYYTAADGVYGGETGGAADPRYHGGICGGPKSPADLGNSFQIYQTPQVLIMVSVPDGVQTFDSWIRRIWISQQHPNDLKDYPAFWMGHSVGHWDGNTLVADTVRIRAGTLVDTARAIPQSGNLHMIERFSFDKKGSLQIERTFEDPVAFTKPWTDMKTLIQPANWERERKEWEIAETHQPCDAKGGYDHLDDPWFDNYDKLKKEILPDQQRLDRGLPPVPPQFRQE